MESHQFDHHARQDPHLAAFMRSVAEEAVRDLTLSEPQRFVTVTGADLLIGLVAYAAYRWTKDYFDQRRAQGELDLATQQTQLITDLVTAGFPRKDAQATVVALLKNIATRSADDPVLTTMRGLLGKGK